MHQIEVNYHSAWVCKGLPLPVLMQVKAWDSQTLDKQGKAFFSSVLTDFNENIYGYYQSQDERAKWLIKLSAWSR